MKKSTFSVMGTIMLVLSMVLSACGSTSKEAQTQSASEKPKLLKVATAASVTTWDPSISVSTESAYLANIYEPLLWVNPPGSPEEFSPALAEKWEHSEDGKVWTFFIRKGVKFHDGADLNAEAVKKSIERTINIGKGSAYLWAPVEKMEVVDEYTLKFHLKYPIPFERIAGASLAAWIMSPNVVDKDEAWFNEGHAAGTGPWKLESYKTDKEVLLTKNENYWGKVDTNFEKVFINIIAEDVVREQMLTSGAADIAYTPIENLKSLEQDPNIQIVRSLGYYNFVGFFNTKKPPLDNKLVRQALSYAVDYDAIIEVATKGEATQAKGPVPQGLWPSDPSLPSYSLNLEKAKELLAQAAVNPADLKLTLTYASENMDEARFAPLIKEGLAKLGVSVNVEPIMWNQQWERGKGDPRTAQDIFILQFWPSYADGYDNLKTMFSTEERPHLNLAYYSNPDFDKMIRQAYALSGTKKEEAKELYLQAQNLLIDEAPAMFFYDRKEVVSMRNTITGDAANPNYPYVTFFHKLKTK
ncbi:MAG TPA: ABC transporter substrate-binding protein [Candidatus Bathyarchaeia archaeon]|nr:ABC transporter substrate-binding protein [Candidatus Bathyarchaeia archaeon]